MFSIFLVILFCFLISIFANWYQAYSFLCIKRENNDWKGQLHAAFNARSMDPEFGSILASGRGGGRRQRIQFYIGIFGGLSLPFSGATSEGLLGNILKTLFRLS